MKIEELNFTVRTYNCLKRAGINTYEELLELTEDDLRQIRGMGTICISEVLSRTNNTELQKKAAPHISVDDDDLGIIINCAVRYACGRRSYMPSVVIGFITPLLSHLSSRTLYLLDQDLTCAKYEYGYGDPKIDEPAWLDFRAKVRAERTHRGEELYKDWRESNE